MLINLQNISKSFGTPGEANHQVVLRDLNFKVGEGETIAILGPSGSGKSTLLNIIGTLEHPDSGSMVYLDKDISGMNESDLDRFRNKEIGFVFQFHHLLPQCNALENVMIPTLISKQKNDQVKYAEHLLNEVGMWEHRFKKPTQLSGGECQRIAVVRSLINRPKLLLADEPTGALDGSNVDAISRLLLKFNAEESVALVLVTHSELLAGQMEKVYKLSEGQLVQQ